MTLKNRNKETLEFFKNDVKKLTQTASEVYIGSYRYKDPAYIFLQEINNNTTAVIVNATDKEYKTTLQFLRSL